MSEKQIKQVIVMRTSYVKNGKPFKMRKGKEIAQAGHAVLGFIADAVRNGRQLNNIELEWLANQKSPKIVLQVETEEELFMLDKMAKDSGVPSYLVRDLGMTEFDEPTYTALGIGPYYAEKIDPITCNLQLY